MADEDKKSAGNHLSAKQLLLTRGINAQAHDEFARSSLVLPKCGEKFFEPNGSWLQDKQISTNLENMRDCLKIERVNRLSLLASADWLPHEKRAIVTKRSGVEWINYGTELNRNLYLIPEEALLLMEMNCLELLYKGLPLSLQQAHTLLLDSPHSESTLQEYQVFSHLSRLGYRLQRFHYDRPQTPTQEPQPKKKLIIPEDGQWTDDKPRRPDKIEQIDLDIAEILNTMITNITAAEDPETSPHPGNPPDTPKTNGASPTTDADDPKPKISKLEIVSEETVLDPIKIIRTSETPKWTAARIQRNVKQLPRRSDKKRTPQISPEKRAEPASKRAKLEVIDLSDDDVQEIPIVPSRTELLNHFPNTAESSWIKAPSDHLPPNVKPQKQMYQCNRRHLDVVNETDRALRLSTRPETSVVPSSVYNPRFRGNGCAWRPGWIGMGLNAFGARRLRNPHWGPGASWVNRMENVVINRMNYSAGAFSKWSHQQINVFRNSMMLGCNMAAGFYNSANVCNGVTWQRNLFRGRPDFRRMRGGRYRGNTERRSPPLTGSESSAVSSLSRIPASSWTELKQKLKEAKTITIEDDEDRMDCSEVEVVEENIQPLVGPKHAGNVAEVFERLRIIKSAQEKTVRKKRGELKISYRVYPNNMSNYRKSNPGAPMFNVVVTSHQKSFPQPVELNRLQQEGNNSPIVFALVSRSSTTYIQTGVISLPNIVNEP